jgi:hypothetical protein
MANSAFWRDLGARFIALRTELYGTTGFNVKAAWTSDHSMTPPMEFYEVRANNPGIRLRFIALAKDGGDALSPNDFVDSLHAWLSALARETHVTGVATTRTADGFELSNPIEASINLCAAMESEMLTSERHQRYLNANASAQNVGSGPPIVDYDGMANSPAAYYAEYQSPITITTGPLPYEILDEAAPRPVISVAPTPNVPNPPPSVPEPESMVPARRVRQSGAIENLHAARRVAKHLDDRGIKQNDFAKKAKISERTLRSFLKTGKLRKGSVSDLCNAMKIDRETLLREFLETGN